MSQLQKAIQRIRRREGPSLGFGPVAREKPRALLAAAMASTADEVAGAIGAGVDVVFVAAEGSDGYLALAADPDSGEAVVGAYLPRLDTDDASSLREAACDFVASPLTATAAAAVDREQMGHVISVPSDVSDTTLRSLGPLGLAALFVELDTPTLTLGSQLNLVRLASFSSTPLFVTGEPGIGVDELRVLRDSGVAGLVLPAGTPVAELEDLGVKLRAVPARKQRGAGEGDMALVPSLGVPAETETETEPPEDAR